MKSMLNKKDIEDQYVILCREYDKYYGNPPTVYEVKCEISGRNIYCLSLRSRANPELAYFMTMRTNWEENQDYIKKSILDEHKLAEFDDFIDDSISTLESRGIIKLWNVLNAKNKWS